MNNELRQYADTYEAELLAYDQLEPAEFIKEYIDASYVGESEEEEVRFQEYFDCLEIQHYRNEESGYDHFEITLGCG